MKCVFVLKSAMMTMMRPEQSDVLCIIKKLCFFKTCLTLPLIPTTTIGKTLLCGAEIVSVCTTCTYVEYIETLCNNSLPHITYNKSQNTLRAI